MGDDAASCLMMPKRLTPRFLNVVLPLEKRGNDVVTVQESLATRLWGNEGQAVVKRVVATTRQEVEVKLIAKRFSVDGLKNQARGTKRKRKATETAGVYGPPSNDAERTESFKLRVRIRSFVAEAAFLRMLGA